MSTLLIAAGWLLLALAVISYRVMRGERRRGSSFRRRQAAFFRMLALGLILAAAGGILLAAEDDGDGEDLIAGLVVAGAALWPLLILLAHRHAFGRSMEAERKSAEVYLGIHCHCALALAVFVLLSRLDGWFLPDAFFGAALVLFLVYTVIAPGILYLACVRGVGSAGDEARKI